MFELILGGARSGKSAYAETLARDLRRPVTYVATCVPYDDGMHTRIEQHRARRPTEWQTYEVGTQPLDEILQQLDHPEQLILVDCMTLWLSQQLMDEHVSLPTAIDTLCDQLQRMQADVILVSGEVGLGVVPMGALTRRFVDELGTLNQRLAQQADRVWWVVAGLPQCLKGSGTP